MLLEGDQDGLGWGQDVPYLMSGEGGWGPIPCLMSLGEGERETGAERGASTVKSNAS